MRAAAPAVVPVLLALAARANYLRPPFVRDTMDAEMWMSTVRALSAAGVPRCERVD